MQPGQLFHAEAAAVGGDSLCSQTTVVREDARQREAILDIRKHLFGGQQRQRPHMFAQHQQARDMINLRIHQQDGSDAGVSPGACRLQCGCLTNLREDVRRGVDQQPVLTIRTDGY